MSSFARWQSDQLKVFVNMTAPAKLPLMKIKPFLGVYFMLLMIMASRLVPAHGRNCNEVGCSVSDLQALRLLRYRYPLWTWFEPEPYWITPLLLVWTYVLGPPSHCLACSCVFRTVCVKAVAAAFDMSVEWRTCTELIHMDSGCLRWQVRRRSLLVSYMFHLSSYWFSQNLVFNDFNVAHQILCGTE